MSLWPSLCKAGARFSLVCVGRFALWSFWLLLGITLGIGLWIATTPRLTLPRPLLRHLERSLSDDSFRVSIGSVVFSPSGELQATDLRLFIDGFDTPVLRIEEAHTSIDPMAVLSGHPGTHAIELSGAQLIIPAQLSPDGTALPVLRDLDADVSYDHHQVTLRRLNTRCADISLRASGTADLSSLLHLTPHAATPTTVAAPSSSLTRDTALDALLRIATVWPHLRDIGPAWIELRLAPDTARIALADATLRLHEFSLPLPAASPIARATPNTSEPARLDLGSITLTARAIPLRIATPFETSLDLHLGRIAAPRISLPEVCARLSLAIDPSAPAAAVLRPLRLELSAPRVSNPWIPITGVSALIEPGPLPRLHSDVALSIAGDIASATADLSTSDLSGSVRARTEVSSDLLTSVSEIIGLDILPFCSFRQRAMLDVGLTLAPGGRIADGHGWVSSDALDVYNIAVEHASGRLSYDGRYLLAGPAIMRIGDDFARGSYGMDVTNTDFRFLLTGRLRPPHISAWIPGWWPEFWADFDFTRRAPDADVDILGRWTDPSRIRVFVGADASDAALRGVSTKQVRTRLWITPSVVDAFDIRVWRPDGFVSGGFRRCFDTTRNLWTRVSFQGTGTVNPQQAARLMGGPMPALASNFLFENAPVATVSGYVNGPGAPAGSAHKIDFTAGAPGNFSLFGYPFADVSFTGTWDGREIRLPRVKAQVGGGTLIGSVRVDTEGETKRIDLNAALEKARLGQTLNDLEGHLARVAGTPFTADPNRAPATFISLNVKASGCYDDALTFVGKGSAHVWGDELAKVQLLGGLSQLLSFTSLRFTSAKAQFVLDGPRVAFPALRIMGHNSAIDANGTFLLDSRGLEFKAKVWPFDQNPGLIQGTLGLMLAPLSHAFEVRLGGTLATPAWSFANNPFRAMTSNGGANGSGETPSPQTQAPASATPP